MKLETILKHIKDYENEACEEFWDNNPELAEKVNITEFFKWMQENRPEDYKFIVKAVTNACLEPNNSWFEMEKPTNDIDVMSKEILTLDLDISTLIWELSEEIEALPELEKYMEKYEELRLLYSGYYEENLPSDLIAIFYYEYLIETKNEMYDKIMSIEYDY